MDGLVGFLVILVLAPFVALIWLIVSVINLSAKARDMRAQLGELAGRLAIIERHGVTAPVEAPRRAAAKAAPGATLEMPVAAAPAVLAEPVLPEPDTAPPLQERQVNRPPDGSGQAGGLTDQPLGWGGGAPQTPRSLDSRRGGGRTPPPQ